MKADDHSLPERLEWSLQEAYGGKVVVASLPTLLEEVVVVVVAVVSIMLQRSTPELIKHTLNRP